MPALLRDVRIVSPAVNLPGPLAAALLNAGCGFAERHGLIPRARFRALAIAGTDPVVQFTAVLDATGEALKPAGLGVDDIGLFKVNEAFVGVPLIARGSSASRTTISTSLTLHRHRAPALLDRRGCSPACPASRSARRRATACRPSAAPPVPPSPNASREYLSCTTASSRAARRHTATTTSSTPAR